MILVETRDTPMERVADEPRISMVRHPEPFRKSRHEARSLALWIAGAALAGLLCGFTALTVVAERHDSTARGVRAEAGETRQTVVPVTYVPQKVGAPQAESAQAQSAVAPPAPAPTFDSRTSQDLERIRARNRRLEALVKVLRKRDANLRNLPSARHNN